MSAAARSVSAYRCSACGHQMLRRRLRCPRCGSPDMPAIQLPAVARLLAVTDTGNGRYAVGDIAGFRVLVVDVDQSMTVDTTVELETTEAAAVYRARGLVAT